MYHIYRERKKKLYHSQLDWIFCHSIADAKFFGFVNELDYQTLDKSVELEYIGYMSREDFERVIS